MKRLDREDKIMIAILVVLVGTVFAAGAFGLYLQGPT